MCGGVDIFNISNPEQDALRTAWNEAMLTLFGIGNQYPSFDELMNSGRPVTEAIAESLKSAMKRGIGKLKSKVDERFLQRLTTDVWVFSGAKSYNELREATKLLRDSSGALKPFSQFIQDVQEIHDKYNRNWLRSEYNHAVGSSRMAAKWQQYEDPDFNLQYRTAGDEKVREDHAALDNTTLPPNDPFWDEYYPPNGWNCRCNVVQVQPDKYPQSDSQKAQKEGEKATTYIDSKGRNRSAMFRFNPGKEGALFPENHPYYEKAPKSKITQWVKNIKP